MHRDEREYLRRWPQLSIADRVREILENLPERASFTAYSAAASSHSGGPCAGAILSGWIDSPMARECSSQGLPACL